MRDSNSKFAGKPGNITVTIISSDDIATLSDDELSNKFSAVKRRIDQGKRKKVGLEIIRSLEVEYCYLSREIDIRMKRRANHEKFIYSSKSRRAG